MKCTLEIPDQDADFVLELLRRVTSVKLTPIGRKPKPKDETEYLLNNPANARELRESIAQIRQGQTVSYKLEE